MAETSTHRGLYRSCKRISASETPYPCFKGAFDLEVSEMEYRAFGSTGLNVSVICYGTMRYASKGGERDDRAAEATRAPEEAVEAGINFFTPAMSTAHAG